MPNRQTAAMLIGMVLILSVTGCSSFGDLSPGSKLTITVQSDPSGATVLADGTDIGTTPLTFKPADAFRAGVTTGGEGILAYRYVGKLTLKKPGCSDYVTEVDDNILSKDIDVKLECDPNYRPPAPQPAMTPQVQPSAVPATQPAMPASAAERLQRIESLHDKGLISDGDYRELRQRVLDTL